MLIVSEDMCKEVVGRADAFDAVEAIFDAMAKGDAYNFPVIREAIEAISVWQAVTVAA
jgi:ornithine cyclodeaminase